MARPALSILITSAGRRAELLQCFRADAERLGVDLTILACDLNPEWSPACQLADRRFAVPRVTSPDYIDELLTICRDNNVSLLVPTLDPELLPLAENRHRFADIGTHVAVSSASLVEMARDKQKTADFFASNGIPTPRTAAAEEARDNPGGWSWPLIIKARHGSASRGLKLAADVTDLPDLRHSEPLVAQEHLLGREYTVNIFFDRDGRLRAVVPHERIQIRAGEVEKGITRRIPQLTDIAQRMADVLPEPSGTLCFQAIIGEDGAPSVFEINARFGGGFPLAHRAGGRFSQWLLEERLGIAASAHNDWRDGVMMLRYDAAVFVDP